MSLTHPPLHSHPYPRVKEKKEVVPIDVDDDESDSDDEEDNLLQVGLREMGGRVHFTFHTHTGAIMFRALATFLELILLSRLFAS